MVAAPTCSVRAATADPVARPPGTGRRAPAPRAAPVGWVRPPVSGSAGRAGRASPTTTAPVAAALRMGDRLGATGGGGRGLSVTPGAIGTGGGGGGGAGASSAAAQDTNVHIATAAQRGNGSSVHQLGPAGHRHVALDLRRPAPRRAGDAHRLRRSCDTGVRRSAGDRDGDLLRRRVGARHRARDGERRRGSGRVTTSTLALGRHTITAAYVGDGIYAGSTSTGSTVTIAAFSQFTSAGTAAAVVGRPVSFLVQTWGYPYARITAAGTLDGLTLTGHPDGTATLAGRPAKAGTFPITFTADNGLNVNATQRFTLTVTLDPLTISTTTLPGAFTGQAYSTALGSAGGTPPVTWAVTAGRCLPASR